MNDQTLIGIYMVTLLGVMLLFLFCLIVTPNQQVTDSVELRFVYRSMFMLVMGFTVSLLV